MSYDKVDLCRSLDKSTWCEKFRLQDQGRWHEVESEFQRAYDKGDATGANLLLDELYLFEHSCDAERFFRTDFVC